MLFSGALPHTFKKKNPQTIKKKPPQLYKHLDNYLSGMSKSNKLIIYGKI